MVEVDFKPFNWRVIVRLGLIGGVIALYVSAIGMVETFAQRSIIGTFTLGQILLYAGALSTGYLVAREIGVEKKGTSLAAALIAGGVAGLPNAGLIFLADTISVRGVLVNVSPALIKLLTFDNSLVVGIVLFVLSSAAVSLLGAAIYLLPDKVQRPITNGLIGVLLFGVFSENVSQIFQQTFGVQLGRSIVRLFFRKQALIPITAVIIFLLVAGLSYLRRARAGQMQARMAALSDTQRQRLRWGTLALGIIIMLLLPMFLGRFLSQVLFLVGLYILMGLGLNIVVGFAGLLDLGYVAFFAFGAYTMGVLTTTDAIRVGNFNFWMALPISVLVAVGFGVLLGFPVLRMRGDYLAITTLGFGEIIRILALSNWLAPRFGGAQGVLHIPNPRIGSFTFDTPEKMYYIVLAGVLLAAFITIRLRDARLGRQWMAMREDEDVAEAMGINLVQTKLLAFAIGAGFSGLSGAIFASRLSNIFPHSFNLLISINVLSLIIVGGMGSIPGVVVGSLILVGMPELLREFAEYRLLMYGLLLITTMLVRPEGFWPAENVKRELHASEKEMMAAELPEV